MYRQHLISEGGGGGGGLVIKSGVVTGVLIYTTHYTDCRSILYL